MRWLIDGNNTMGARPDGWWRDRAGAAGRLADEVAAWCRAHPDEVVLVFDGRPVDAVLARSGEPRTLRVEYAPRRGRDGADDRLVELALDGPETTVVTSDRGLIARLPAGVRTLGARALLDRLAASAPGAGRPDEDGQASHDEPSDRG